MSCNIMSEIADSEVNKDWKNDLRHFDGPQTKNASESQHLCGDGGNADASVSTLTCGLRIVRVEQLGLT